MIQMEVRHFRIVQEILGKYPYSFYAFGSRAKKTQKPFSDLDLCFVEPISWEVLAKISEDFEESNLPFKVELINWHRSSETFQNLIRKDLVLIQGKDFLQDPGI